MHPTRWLFLLTLGVSLGCSEAPKPPAPPLRNPNTAVSNTPAPVPKVAALPAPSEGPKNSPRVEVEEKDPRNVTQVPRVEADPESKEKPEQDPPLPANCKLLFPEQSQLLYVENLEGGKRRVHLMAEVCLRSGQLEALLCKNVTKEHESILRVDADGRMLHSALIVAGGNPGSPAKFWDPKTDTPTYQPANGSPFKISLTYYLKGQLRTDPAQYWIRDAKANKELQSHWVFAGSRFVTPPDDPKGKPFYTANNGDFVSIANFPDSMMDLPVRSSKENEERSYEAYGNRIPPIGTKVLMTFEVIPPKGE